MGLDHQCFYSVDPYFLEANLSKDQSFEVEEGCKVFQNHQEGLLDLEVFEELYAGGVVELEVGFLGYMVWQVFRMGEYLD